MLTTMKRRSSGVVVAFAAMFLGSAKAQKTEVFKFSERPGPLPVGLQVVQQYERSNGGNPSIQPKGQIRPIQTLVWYPAQAGGVRSMTVADYAKLLETESSFDKPALTKDSAAILEGIKPTLGLHTRAFRDAPKQGVHYPVVIYAPSSAAPSWENADLCEYLASYGYVVVASPGARGGPGVTHLTRANEQATDISFLIDYAKTLPDTDTSTVAVVGFSWGGLSNLFAAARDTRIKALVSLDGSLRYESAVIQQAGDVHPSDMKIPLLYLSEGHFTMEEIASTYDPRKGVNLNPEALNDWTGGDRIIVYMLGLIHEEFSSLFQRDENVWKLFSENHKADYTRADGTVGYGLIARYTLNFLSAYLKHDATGASFLKKTPAENGAPLHAVQVSFRKAGE